MTSLNSQTINNGFGVQVNDATRGALKDPDFKSQCLKLWAEFGGLLVVRGDDLSEMTPQELVDFSEVFGDIEQIGQTAREKAMVGDYPILRIGNVRDDKGELRASLSRVPQLTSDEDVRYNPATRRPVWHTDSLFRKNPPIGSVFHCRQAPPNGGETLFADMHAGYERLHDDKRAQLDELEAVCSLAHHDKKINAYSPDYPILNAEQRAANPPQRVPLVLTHPTTGRKAIYGLNSSTCAVVPKARRYRTPTWIGMTWKASKTSPCRYCVNYYRNSPALKQRSAGGGRLATSRFGTTGVRYIAAPVTTTSGTRAKCGD